MSATGQHLPRQHVCYMEEVLSAIARAESPPGHLLGLSGRDLAYVILTYSTS